MIILLLMIVLYVIHDHCLRQEASKRGARMADRVAKQRAHASSLPFPLFSLARVPPSRAEAQRALLGDLSIESAI